MNRIILLVWLCLAALCTFLTSCGPNQTAEFKAKEYFFNSRTKQMTTSPYVEIIKVDAHYAEGDTIITPSLFSGSPKYILVQRLPLLAN